MAADGPSGWGRLFHLAAADSQEQGFLDALLERWCRDTGARGAAFYLEEGDELRRQQVTGEGVFPDALGGQVPDALASLRLPEGLLLYAPAAGVAAPDPAPEGPLPTLVALSSRVAALNRQLKRQRFEASYRGVEQQALYDVGLAITATLNLEELSESILTWALALLDARRAALYLLEDGRYRLRHALGGDAREAFENDDPDSLPEDVLPAATHLEAARIEIGTAPLGMLVVADKESRHGVGPFGDADRRTLQLFANQAAIALENARLHRQALEAERLEREMELAAEIQRQILPKTLPELPGYEVTGWNRPARQVGGDYYDLRLLSEGRLILTVGDVSGKGMPAALMVFTLHSALRLMLDRHDFAPPLLERLNRHILDSSASNKFITLVVAELDAESGRLSYLNAGHNPGVLVTASGSVQLLPPGGMPVGLFPAATYQSNEVEVRPGDLLCLYSDGITECATPEGEEFELDRLVELLRQHRDAPLEEVVAAVDTAVTDFAQGQPQGDDQTVVLLRRR